MTPYRLWRIVTGPFRQCWIEDGYCLTHSTSKCAERGAK